MAVVRRPRKYEAWLACLALLAQGAPPIAAEERCPADAVAFWSSFRQAALRDDMPSLMAASRFPFALRGLLDAEGTRWLDQAGFLSAWPRMAATDPGLTGRPSDMRTFALTAAMPESCDDDGFRIGEWAFARTGGGWRFVHAYVDDP